MFIREDLQYWLSENQAELRNGTPEAVEKHAEIRCTVDNVWQQQSEILTRLQNDRVSLERELKLGLIPFVNPLITFDKTFLYNCDLIYFSAGGLVAKLTPVGSSSECSGFEFVQLIMAATPAIRGRVLQQSVDGQGFFCAPFPSIITLAAIISVKYFSGRHEIPIALSITFTSCMCQLDYLVKVVYTKYITKDFTIFASIFSVYME